ncbi:MAG: SdpI family protein [Clostridiaceae bacterium]|nr:SdpI family protein [Clostridiaceae bacterium]
MKDMTVLTVLIIPATMLATGLIFRKWAPKSINYLLGYRTRRSTINDDTWIFANRTMGVIWTRWGLLMLIPSLILVLVFLNQPTELLNRLSLILTVIQLVLMVLSIIPVERALKARFDEKGRRKERSGHVH